MKNKIHILFFFVLMLNCTVIYAQQLPLYSQYMLNDYVLNPAVAGKNNYFEAKSNNRYQWIGITDAPRTYILSVNGPGKRKNIGLGGYLFTDIVGPTRRIGCDATYAYHAKINENIKLGLGLSAGILQFAVDASKINLHDPVDQVISTGYQSVLVPNLGSGLYLYNSNWYFGFSVPQIYAAKLKFFDYMSDTDSKLATHFFSNAGYSYKLNDDISIEPSILLKYVSPAPPQLDISVRGIYKNTVWVGGTFRTKDAFSLLLGAIYKDGLMFGYSYDMSTTNIKNYSSGTHELVLGIRFGIKEQDNYVSSDITQ